MAGGGSKSSITLIVIALLAQFQFVGCFRLHTYSQMRKSRVPRALVGRTYPVDIGQNLWSSRANISALRCLDAASKVLVITDDVISNLHLDLVMSTLMNKYANLEIHTLVLPTGEHEKSIDSVMKICDKALSSGLDRRSVFIALGGGVVGDLVGFASSIYLRGIDFIQVPTTLMAMVDSSVGGKTAVNRPLGKNMVGTFHNPKGVIIDISMLSTLSNRMFASGIAEMIKYGLVYDPSFFEYLEQHLSQLLSRDSVVLANSIQLACKSKVGRFIYMYDFNS
jgi:3-dehydroquinate synthase